MFDATVLKLLKLISFFFCLFKISCNRDNLNYANSLLVFYELHCSGGSGSKDGGKGTIYMMPRSATIGEDDDGMLSLMQFLQECDLSPRSRVRVMSLIHNCSLYCRQI